MLKSLLGFSENPEATFLIEEVWALDSAQHGDSRLLNEGKLGVTCRFSYTVCKVKRLTLMAILVDWHDNARDILNFVTHYLPETFDPAALPTHLGRIPDEIAASRCGFGFSNRRVVAVGHSFGGCST